MVDYTNFISFILVQLTIVEPGFMTLIVIVIKAIITTISFSSIKVADSMVISLDFKVPNPV